MTKIDIKLTADSTGIYDIDVADDGDLLTTQGYDTAILMSVLCERRASEGQVPNPSMRRGWCGNEDGQIKDFQIGSLVWLFDQQRSTSSTASGIEAEAKNGLSWMLDDNLVDKIEAFADFTYTGVVSLIVQFVVDNNIETNKFELWSNTGGN